MKIKRIHKDAILPRYATDGSSAFDLFCYKKPIWELNSNMLWTTLIPTGWAFQVPEEMGLFILSRSGHGFNDDTTLSNSVGLLDFDYHLQGMVKLISLEAGHPNVKAGQAVAQCVLMNTPRIYFSIVDELDKVLVEHRGFGSTDK